MAGDFTKRTQATLGEIIKKPPLTTKLLSKPPFRFLHDVFTEVIKTTGFLNGLFSPIEMDSKNVSVKEDKMAFLQKVIDVVSLVSGEQLSARPSKIVAGHEPEKTNELLQAVAKCIEKNISSDDAVQQVISGKKSSKVQEKPPAGSSKKREGKENRERPDEPRKKKRDKDEEKPERERSSDRRKRSAGKDKRERSKDKESSREQGAGEGSEDNKESHRSRDKTRDKERNKEEHSRDRREGKKDRKESKTRIKSDDVSSTKKNLERKSSTKTLQKSLVKERKSSISKNNKKGSEKRRKKSTSRREEETEQNDEDSEVRGKRRDHDEEEEQERPSENQDEDRDERNEKPASTRPPRPASAKGHRRRQAPDRGAHGSAIRNEEPSTKEINRSKQARPPSARPAAPRVRQRPNPAEEEIERMESAGRQRTAPIIVDGGERQPGEGISFSDDDEDEQFLVQDEDDDSNVQPPEMEKLSPMLNGDAGGEVEDEEAGEHGGLVKKILQTKQELETLAAKGSTAKKRTEIERAPVNEVQRRKERELVMRDIEKLRASVQKLCRSAVPLGKIIDYIQEDMDSMQNELMQWKKENKEHAARLKEEESITIKTIEPMQAELDELDRSITYQLDMIAASKCNVIRNQEKIDKMVAGVTARS